MANNDFNVTKRLCELTLADFFEMLNRRSFCVRDGADVYRVSIVPSAYNVTCHLNQKQEPVLDKELQGNVRLGELLAEACGVEPAEYANLFKLG